MRTIADQIRAVEAIKNHIFSPKKQKTPPSVFCFFYIGFPGLLNFEPILCKLEFLFRACIKDFGVEVVETQEDVGPVLPEAEESVVELPYTYPVLNYFQISYKHQ